MTQHAQKEINIQIDYNKNFILNSSHLLHYLCKKQITMQIITTPKKGAVICKKIRSKCDILREHQKNSKTKKKQTTKMCSIAKKTSKTSHLFSLLKQCSTNNLI